MVRKRQVAALLGIAGQARHRLSALRCMREHAPPPPTAVAALASPQACWACCWWRGWPTALGATTRGWRSAAARACQTHHSWATLWRPKVGC